MKRARMLYKILRDPTLSETGLRSAHLSLLSSSADRSYRLRLKLMRDNQEWQLFVLKVKK